MMRNCLCAGLVALSGCGLVGGVDPEVAEQLGTCGADAYVNQLGEPLRDAVLPRGPEIRVVTPSMLGSLGETVPTRLNLELDEAGVIIGVYCG